MEILAVGIGIAISFLLVANAALARYLGPVAALLAVHILGLAVALPVAGMAKPRPAAEGGPIPWFLFGAGLVGVVLLLINNRTIPVLGAGLSVALGVLGQLAASAAVDLVGLFGLAKRPFRPRRAIGLMIAVGGAFLMGAGAVR